MKLTDEQQDVFDQAVAFVRDRSPAKQWFTYEAAAGCGKTVVLAELAHRFRGAALCAFTGKAASVLTRKSGLAATTIHSAIYQFHGLDEDEEPIFSRKIDDGDWHGQLVLVDEIGTVGQRLGRDLLATGCKVIGCGDREQLLPVNDRRYFDGVPDAHLTTVHRQAWDSAIIRQAHEVLAGRGCKADGDDFRIVRQVTHDDIVSADIVLCWRNATRMMLNKLMREHRGIAPDAPVQKGEPVMCLRNDHKKKILNGAVYTALADRPMWGDLRIENEQGAPIWAPCSMEDLDSWRAVDEDEKIAPFALGYAATVHKAQGSEYEKVILIDEYDREDRARWLYTAITRASQSIIVQRSW